MLSIYDCFPMDHGGYPDQSNTVGGSLITSWAGGRPNPFTGRPSWHGGMDLVPQNPYRRPLRAVVRGRVWQAWDPGGGGNWTRLEATGSSAVFGYGHADGYAVPSLNGKIVEPGTIIAYLGTTGASTGFHLHFAERSTPGSAWGDPYAGLLRTAQAGRFAGQTPNPEPQPEPEDPHTEFPPNTTITLKELYDMGCVFAVDSGPQVTLNTATQSLNHVPGEGRRKLLLFTMNVQRHPLAGEEWVHLDWNNPQHQAACDDYYENWMPTLPPHLRHDDRPRGADGKIIR